MITFLFELQLWKKFNWKSLLTWPNAVGATLENDWIGIFCFLFPCSKNKKPLESEFYKCFQLCAISFYYFPFFYCLCRFCCCRVCASLFHSRCVCVPSLWCVTNESRSSSCDQQRHFQPLPTFEAFGLARYVAPPPIRWEKEEDFALDIYLYLIPLVHLAFLGLANNGPQRTSHVKGILAPQKVLISGYCLSSSVSFSIRNKWIQIFVCFFFFFEAFFEGISNIFFPSHPTHSIFFTWLRMATRDGVSDQNRLFSWCAFQTETKGKKNVKLVHFFPPP